MTTAPDWTRRTHDQASDADLLNEALIQLELSPKWMQDLAGKDGTHPAHDAECRLIVANMHRVLTDEQLERAAIAAADGVIAALVARGWRPRECG